MLAVVYLLIACAAGFAVATRVLPGTPAIVRLPAGFLLAVVFTSWTTYLVAAGLSGTTDASLTIGIVVSTLCSAGVLATFGRRLRPRDVRMPGIDVAVGVFALALSWWLMDRHLRTTDGELIVSFDTWRDMGLHVSLARSFSMAGNYPTEYPFFAGEPIRYHFGFDFFAGMLQKGGISVLWSFNLPGIIGFTALMLITFALTRLLFGPKRAPAPEGAPGAPRWWRDRGVWAGFVAVAMLMTNQSLGWRRYLDGDAKGDVLTALDPSTWWAHKGYLAAGPYTDDRIAMFNTLNAYLTQTHLIVAMALMLLLTYVVLWQLRGEALPSKRLVAGVGVTFGVGFWLNGVVWLATAVFLGVLLVLSGAAATRRAFKAAEDAGGTVAAQAAARDWLAVVACFAVPALAFGVPQALMLNGGGSDGGLKVHLGYLVCASSKSSCHGGEMDLLSLADWWSFVQYWWLNEAVFIPLLVIAFVIGSRRDRRIITALTFIFLWGSVFHVGEDIGGQNHKVFNLWENVAGPFVAYAFVAIWLAGGRLLHTSDVRRRIAGAGTRVAAVAAGFLLVATGFVDFMTIKNDSMTPIFGDREQRDATAWIAEHTPPRATFLTDYDQLFTAPALAGRPIHLGYSSWAEAAGYDTEPRKQFIAAVYGAPDRAAACALLLQTGLDFVMDTPLERTSPRFAINQPSFTAMTPAATFGEDDGQYRIYSIAENCGAPAGSDTDLVGDR